MKAIVSVFAKDSKGITAYVTALLAEKEINILDISQTLMQEYFAMIMLVDLARCNVDHVAMRDRFTALGAEMKMQVTVTRQEVFDAMHTI